MVGLLLIGLVLTVMAVVFSTFVLGRVNGEEFSPDNFTRRTFSYFEVPLLGLQVSPIYRNDRTNSLESFLTTGKLVKEIKTTDDQRRWDLVVAARGSDSQDQQMLGQGDARILCSYLDAEGPKKDSIWLDWSKQHPALAKLLWSTVAKLARQELYPFIPELFDAARSTTDPAALRQRMDELLSQRYHEFARAQQQLGNHEAAVELFTEAIQHAPQMVEAFSGRAASLISLGQPDRAAADSAQARTLASER